MLHILGLAHVQNRADRCNYIDVNTELLQASGGNNWTEIIEIFLNKDRELFSKLYNNHSERVT